MSESLQVPDYSHQNNNPSDNSVQGGGSSVTGSIGGLNETLNTSHIDIPSSDTSMLASVTRFIAGHVGKCFSPHQILVFLRLLKAVTFCFLILNIFAVFMYMLFVDIMASDEVRVELGGSRDLVLRVYALVLSAMSILLELDVTNIVRHYSGLKGFIPRSFLLYFISVITTTVTIPAVPDDDTIQYDDDNIAVKIAAEIPESAVVFQRVTSWTLSICACAYLVLGMLCFDRFTSKAFISTTNPIISTAIPQQNSIPNSSTVPSSIPANNQVDSSFA